MTHAASPAAVRHEPGFILTSPVHPRAQLNDPRAARAEQLAEEPVVDVGSKAPGREIRAVERVEHISPQLQGHPARKRDIPGQ